MARRGRGAACRWHASSADRAEGETLPLPQITAMFRITRAGQGPPLRHNMCTIPQSDRKGIKIMVATIDGALFQRMIVHGAASINAQKESINELNVFPVPDGDTGTNMSLTIGAAAAEAKKKPAQSVGQADRKSVG